MNEVSVSSDAFNIDYLAASLVGNNINNSADFGAIISFLVIQHKGATINPSNVNQFIKILG